MNPDVILTAVELRALEQQRLIVPLTDAVFHLTGSGVAECLQGVLTNDVIKPGSNSLVWGALLTAKGMIVSDAWVRRRDDEAWVVVPRTARDTIQQLFARSFPPRLAKVRDVTDSLSVRWLVGGAPDSLTGADLVRPSSHAPFTALLLSNDAARDEAHLTDAGWHLAPTEWADALRLLEGWPTLGREIDEKTLPQEVRFDELDGVRYDKGCYTGQETVARVHFRGHPNRTLRGLRWSGDAGPSDASVSTPEREVGSVRTLARVGSEWLGLAVLRREVLIGDQVVAGRAPAAVVELPFDVAEDALA